MTRVILEHNGLPREYLLHTPSTAVGASRPMVIVLHGTGGTAEWAEEETGWIATADRHGFVLLLPQGLPPDRTTEPRFLSNPPRWNDAATLPGDPLHSDTDDVSFLDAVIDDGLRRTPGNPARVYLCGFSNGAGMTFRYAAERSTRLAAIAPVAGYCWVHTPRLVQPVPTLYLVGEADPLIPLDGATVRLPWGNRLVERPAVWETLRSWAKGMDCCENPLIIGRVEGITEWIFPGSTEFRVVTLAGHGHHWPGGKGRMNPRIAGTPTQQLDGNERIWSFFAKHGADHP